MDEAGLVRDVHRIVDLRLQQALGYPVEVTRGIIVEVMDDRTFSATLDGADSPTQGIAYGLEYAPAAGDDVVVLRRRDGFLLLHSILAHAD